MCSLHHSNHNHESSCHHWPLVVHAAWLDGGGEHLGGTRVQRCGVGGDQRRPNPFGRRKPQCDGGIGTFHRQESFSWHRLQEDPSSEQGRRALIMNPTSPMTGLLVEHKQSQLNSMTFHVYDFVDFITLPTKINAPHFTINSIKIKK